MKAILLITVTILTLSACKKESPNPLSQPETLLFKSGFEGNVYIDENILEDSEDYRFIRGTDSETGYT